MKKILPLILLISFICSSLFSYDLKPNERIKQKVFMEYIDRDKKEDDDLSEMMYRLIKEVDTFIAKIGDQNVLDIKVNFLAIGFGVVYILIYKVKV